MGKRRNTTSGSTTPRYIVVTWAVAVVIAVVALGLAAWALLMPPAEPEKPSHNSIEVAGATAAVCQAYDQAPVPAALQRAGTAAPTITRACRR